MPTWEWEQRYMLPTGSLKNRANQESYEQAAKTNSTTEGQWDRKTGGTNDLLFGWEIYSRTGIGTRLSGADPEFAQAVESFGDGVFLAVAPGIDFPLNLPTYALKS